MRILAVLTALVFTAPVLSACGGKKSPSRPVDGITQGSVQDTGAPLERDDTSKTLEEIIEEVEAYPAPDGVEKDIYAELMSEFVSALSDRYSDTDGNLKFAVP